MKYNYEHVIDEASKILDAIKKVQEIAGEGNQFSSYLSGCMHTYAYILKSLVAYRTELHDFIEKYACEDAPDLKRKQDET